MFEQRGDPMLKLSRMRTAFDRAFRNEQNENLEKIEEANNALEIKMDSLISGTIDDAALQTDIEQKLNDLETQYAPKLSEVTIQLADNEARLDTKAEQSEVENINKYVTRISEFELPIPSDFPKERIPFNLFYDVDGNIKHDHKLDLTGTSIFWSEASGVDTNNGLSLTTPVKTIKKALDLANTITGDVVINLMDKIYTRNTTIYSQDSATPFQMEKNITMQSLHEQSYIGTIEKIGTGGISFTQDGTAWKAPRSNSRWVVDLKYKDEEGKPLTYKKVDSLALCQSTQGSFYTDGTNLWIRRVKDEAILADEILVILNTSNLYIYTNSKRLCLKDISFFYNWDTNQQPSVRFTGTPTSRVVGVNCSFSYGGGNGFESTNNGLTALFDCNSYYNGHDGFNYHEVPISTDPYTLAFEYNCKGYRNGHRPGRTQGINNGSTAHEGIYILRVGTVVFENEGPNIADVNGCYSVNFNCIAYNSIRPYNDGRKAGFIISDESSVKRGKGYFFNCAGGGTNTYAIGNQSNSDIYIHKFRGENIEPSVLNDFKYM